jgi:hypothetical protein
MNMVTHLSEIPKPSPVREGFRRTGVPSQTAAPDEVVTLSAITFDRLLTTRQVSAILNVSIETLKKWRQRHKNLLFLRLPSGAIRYRLSTITIFLDGCDLRGLDES